MEASALRAPAALRRAPSARLLRLRSDDQLVALFRAGHDEAFGVLHDRYRVRLHAYTRQMLGGNGSDAEDALQDVFLRAYHALRADDRPITLRAWLYRVAHNRCIDQLRRPASQSLELPEHAHALEGSGGADPHADAQRRDDLRRLVADIGRLPEQQRSALLMREMAGMSYQELGDALDVTVPAIKSLLVRARVGLVEAQEARDTACCDIRAELEAAHDRGVRASGRSRRHLRECSSCRDHRDALKGVRAGLAALSPDASGWSSLLKLLGLGGAGSAAGGGATIGGGATATGVTIGGGAAAATATKVVAVVCCAAVVGGGVSEVSKHVDVGSTPAAASAPAAAKAATVKRVSAAASAIAAAAVPVAAGRASDLADERTALRAATERATALSDAAAEAPPMAAWAVEPPAPVVGRHEGSTYAELSAADRAGGVLGPDEAPAAPSSTTGSSQAGTGTGTQADAGGPASDLLPAKDKPTEPAPVHSGPVSSTAPEPTDDDEGETSLTPGGAAAPGG